MRNILFYFLTIIALTCSSTVFAQQQPEKSPEEYAIEEAVRLEETLALSGAQMFYVDSILRANYVGMSEEMDAMRARGGQDMQSYQKVSEKWQQSMLSALKAVLDEQQYIKYLRHIGKGQGYKKGKDGKYYLKEDTKKKKKE